MDDDTITSAAPQLTADLRAYEEFGPLLGVFGWAAFILGVSMMAYAMLYFDATVAPATPIDSLGLPSGLISPRTYNNGLLISQLMLLISGAAAFIGGTVMISASRITATPRDLANPTTAKES